MHKESPAPTRVHCPEPIAIVGIGCRMPGGIHTPEGFWELLAQGRDVIGDVPPERWDIRRFYDPDPDKPGKIYVQRGGFLKQRIDEFDAMFFGVLPREAACMDPQQRVLLEVAWEAFEDAGIPPDQLAGSDTGVFIGGFTLDNKLTQMSPENRERIGPHTAVGSTMTMLSNRLSYVFDLRGPSLSIDTACSSSLVAFHYACQSIWRNECRLALTGGVNIMFRPEYMVALCKGKFLAPDGCSKSFDERANGYGRGEGAGVVVLKPLAAALADNDPIYALVRGTGVNQDGRTPGITVPSLISQQQLINDVCQRAGVNPHDIRFVEAHGTGTTVGDPIEARALGAALGVGRDESDACVVGSVKSNIGHLEAASGIAGVIKLALSLTHRAIPPIANLQRPNPAIPFANLGLRLARTLETLADNERPLLAAINSFGYGGTNAHAILEVPPRAPSVPRCLDNPAAGPFVLPLSARGPSALQALASAYVDRLTGPDAPSLADVCYSAALHRTHHDQRLALVADSPAQMIEQLKMASARIAFTKAASGREVEPVFVYSGMGPQWWAMGRELLNTEPVFKEALHRCDELFTRLAGWSILAEMTADQAHSRITETHIAQPANVVLQIALTELWRHRGVQPAAVVGHSVGEVTAAWAAGVLTLEETLRVAFERSRIQKKAAGRGKMLAAGLSESEASALLGESADVAIAAVNGPSAVTLSGNAATLEELAARLQLRGVFHRLLNVEVPYHSPYMELLKPELRERLRDLKPRAAELPLYSTVTGRLVEGVSYDAEYWCDNVRAPVRFQRVVDSLVDAGYRTFLEVGPHPVLSGSIKECLAARAIKGNVFTSLRREQPERHLLAEALGNLYAVGAPINWRQHHASARHYVKLPHYPWQRERHWQESAAAEYDRVGVAEYDLLGQRLDEPGFVWESRLYQPVFPYFADHRVEGLTVVPGATYVEAGLALARAIDSADAAVLEDLEFFKALIVSDSEEPRLRFVFEPTSCAYAVYSKISGAPFGWTLHATGQIVRSRLPAPGVLDIAAIRESCDTLIPVDVHYARMRERGLEYGEYFQGVRELRAGAGQVLALIEADARIADVSTRHQLHPTLLDACLQSLIGALDGQDRTAYLPVGIRQLRFHRPPGNRFWCYGRLHHQRPERIEGDLLLCDEAGTICVELRGLRCQALKAQATAPALDAWTYQWQWQRASAAEAESTGGAWLVFSDSVGVGQALARELRAQGAENIVNVTPGAGFQRLTDDHFEVARGNEADLAQLFADPSAKRACGIVYLWALDAPSALDDPTGFADLCAGLSLVKACARSALNDSAPRLYIITQGAQAVLPQDRVALAQAPLVGLARVAFNEQPSLRVSIVDIDACVEAADLAHLVTELLANSTEDDVALRNGERYVHRLERVALNTLPKRSTAREQADGAGSFVLRQAENAGADAFWEAAARTMPGAQEIELEVDAGALLQPFGLADQWVAAGRVARVGAAVTQYSPDQRVVALVTGPLARHLLVSATAPCVMTIPSGLSFDDACALALPLAVARYGLVELARLKAGQTVLIHGIEHPFGRIALSLARALGAQVLVGTTDATSIAADTSLDTIPRLDTHRVDFSEQVSTLTAGRGVDVVWSCAAAPLATDILAPCAHVVRIRIPGAPPNAYGAAPRTPNVTWTILDIESLARQHPTLWQPVWPAIPALELCDMPSCLGARTYSADRMQQARTPSGPMFELPVIDLREPPSVLEPAGGVAVIRPEASYLITGGLGGFGLTVAQWLVAQGARHLVLVGRRAPSNTARAIIAQIENAGARVEIAAADIGDEAAVRRLIEQVSYSQPPLAGIVHSAGVLDDAPLEALDPDRMHKVFSPKALGAWHLHRATLDRSLDFFLLFSSVSSLIGNSRQANYVAANSFLDSLAHYRRAQGLPATSINWGALGEVGMAAAEAVATHLQALGIRAFTPQETMQALGIILERQPIQIGVMDVDWNQWARAEPMGGASPRFSQQVTPVAVQGEAAPAQQLRRRLAQLAPDDRREVLTLVLAEVVAEALKLPIERVDVNRALNQMGVDSLMAVEIQTALDFNLGIKASTLELMKDASLLQLAGQFLARMGAFDDRPAPDRSPPDEVMASESEQLVV